MSHVTLPASGKTDPPPAGLLARVGLHRPELRAWAMYDWANSAMVLVIMTAVFPIYYGNVAGEGHGNAAEDFWYPLSKSIATAIVAVLSPGRRDYSVDRRSGEAARPRRRSGGTLLDTARKPWHKLDRR
jgi:hypothetical protein